ncbi:MAG: VOC family protein [Pseudomonadota bacterium]
MSDALGVEVPRRGKHDEMSTHNCLMQAGNENFFELIAIDAEASAPGRTRWFTLDDPATQARLSERPCALCWVVNTDDLHGAIAASPVDLGDFGSALHRTFGPDPRGPGGAIFRAGSAPGYRHAQLTVPTARKESRPLVHL